MKKIILGILAVAALTACDPSLEKNEWSGEKMSKEQLTEGISIKQYGGDKNTCDYTEVAGGNWIEFATNPSKVVRVYYVKADGSQVVLSKAKANGIFYFKPSRGSDPTQTLYFETLEFDGTSVTGEKQITVEVAQTLSHEMALLCSYKGEKTWKWDVTGGPLKDDNHVVWGNMGSDAGGQGADISGYIWWGISDPADLAGQSQHVVSGDAKPGEYDVDASMVFNEDGTVKCYDKDGNVIRTGSFEIQNYDTEGTWSIGTLHTSEGATLFPYEINAGGKFVTDFEIHKLTVDKLVLVYPDGGAWSGNWQEATYWAFSCDTDPDGYIAGDWTWDIGGGMDGQGRVWGNMGADAGWGGSTIESNGMSWWGVTDAAQLADQSQHVAGIAVPGEYDNNCWMHFDGEGNVVCFDKDGNQIRTGTYDIQNWDPTFTKDAWKAGTLHTSEGATLFPYEINAGGKFVTDYEIHTLNSNKMTLVYPDGGTWSGWQEATYWCFKKK